MHCTSSIGKLCRPLQSLVPLDLCACECQMQQMPAVIHLLLRRLAKTSQRLSCSGAVDACHFLLPHEVSARAVRCLAHVPRRPCIAVCSGGCLRQAAPEACRDLKLENIFLTKAGEVMLGDFGLTMSTDQELAVSPVGTVEYMAPEVQCHSHVPCSLTSFHQCQVCRDMHLDTRPRLHHFLLVPL